MADDHRAAAYGHRFAEHSRGAHRARWLATVDEAYALLQRLVDAATRSVCIEMYLLREEGPAAALGASLRAALERGVEVRVMLDAFGSEGAYLPFLAPLREAGARVTVFNPYRLLRRSLRNHRKLVVVDGEHALVGGFNIGPEYAGDGVNQGWCDTGVYVGGPFVRELQRSFDTMFDLAPFTPGAIRRFRAGLHEGRRERQPGAPVRLLQSGPLLTGGALRQSLYRDLAGAREVCIASAYFLPSLPLRRLLYRVARQGRVRALLAGHSDVPLARLAAQRFYGRLLKRGVLIFEYQPQILHAKLVITDDVVSVGSCNLDRRSLHINCELLLRFEWPELAADARQWFEDSLAHAEPVDRRAWRAARGFWQRAFSRLAYLLLARIDPLVARRGLKGLS